MNDAHWLTAGRSKRRFILPRREGTNKRQDLKGRRQSKRQNWKQQRCRSERSISYSVDSELAQKRWKRGIWNVRRTEKSHVWVKPKRPTVEFKYVKDRTYGGFFPGKTCNLILVRGTISFYNQRLQILPVGGSAVWNMSMWLNEQCWMWTILFSAMPH